MDSQKTGFSDDKAIRFKATGSRAMKSVLSDNDNKMPLKASPLYRRFGVYSSDRYYEWLARLIDASNSLDAAA